MLCYIQLIGPWLKRRHLSGFQKEKIRPYRCHNEDLY